ncbi:NUDIX hydrolase [Candidatus Woesebacteria bacterium]|nr:NUDIX hydrolase [Candidatus Woesebacteria bacterium]
MKKISRKIVAALILSTDHKLLMVKKNPAHGGVYLNTWHIPGGGVEPNESLPEAIVREIFEETGLVYPVTDVVLVDDKGSNAATKTLPSGETVWCEMQFWVYAVQLTQSASDIVVRLSEEHTEYVWADVTKIYDYELTPPSVELFKRVNISKL